MRQRERRVVRTLRRIQEFVANEVDEQSPVRIKLLPRLEASLARLDALAAEQDLGMRLQMAATRRQNALADSLRNNYVVPLSQIAEALGRETPTLRAGLRAPHKRVPRETLVRAAQSMAVVAQRFSTALEGSIDAGFLRDMRSAADALERALAARNAPMRRHIAARAGVEHELSRARQVVRSMDTLLQVQLSDSGSRLAAWNRIKRYE